MSDKAKYSFKCLGQECDSQACHTREQVRVTLGDLARWTISGELEHIIPRIAVFPDKDDPELLAMVTFPKPMKADPKRTACVFYDEDNKSCGIAYSKPISCRTYPLEYDGNKYYISDKDCRGIGQGEVTKESLKEAKDLAEQDYNERVFTRHVLPGLYSVVMNTVSIQNQVALSNLSEEDRKKLEELVTKASPKEPAPDKPQTETPETESPEKTSESE
jgi:Fe-S-cluster containining protein